MNPNLILMLIFASDDLWKKLIPECAMSLELPFGLTQFVRTYGGFVIEFFKLTTSEIV